MHSNQLKATLPKNECEPDENIKLTVFDVVLLDKAAIAKALETLKNTGVHIAEETVKEANKFLERPVDAAKDLLPNVEREINKGLDNLFGR